MNYEYPLKKYLHPILPSKKLKNKMIKFSVFGKDIILFRNKEGKASALLDRCAHRFTPLSLGHIDNDRKVVIS